VNSTREKQTRRAEARLIRSAQRGDGRAVREIVDLHKDRLFSFIYRMVRNYHDTEEICQDALLKAFASLDTFNTEYRFSTWLFTIGYRVCLNRLRRKQEVVGDLDVSPLSRGPEDSLAIAESEDASRLRDVVWTAVDQLSPAQRATVLLFYRHEMGCHEIAQVLELPVATVKSHLHRARARLKDLLGSMDEHNLDFFRNRVADAG
jgi:RNA polymerase sigma-70 factor (ECF subfamily)